MGPMSRGRAGGVGVNEMCIWRSGTAVPGSPTQGRELLTDPDAIARWPISLGVDYTARPAGGGSEVDASVFVRDADYSGASSQQRPRHCFAAGALSVSLERLARELEPALRKMTATSWRSRARGPAARYT
jgi:hypothetical protein